MSVHLEPSLGDAGIYGDGEVWPEYIVEGVAHGLPDEVLHRVRGLGVGAGALDREIGCELEAVPIPRVLDVFRVRPAPSAIRGGP
jgi:hypothetical protein